MATSISNGASASVSIPAGQVLTTTGVGIATIGPGPQANQQIGLQGANSLGPWDYAATVYLTGTASLSYTVAAPITTSPASAADLLPVATVQSLASGGGISTTAAALLTLKRAGTLTNGATYTTENGYQYRADSASHFVPVAGAPILTGSRTTLFGDSIADNQGQSGAPTTLGIVQWAGANLPVPPYITNFRGVSGTSLGQALASQVPSLLTDLGEIAWLHSGINHILPTAVATTVEAAATALRALLAAVAPFKLLVIVDAALPATFASHNRSLEIPRLNIAFAKVCGEFPNVVFNDIFNSVVNTASGTKDVISAATYDGVLHPNSYGACEAGRSSAVNLAGHTLILDYFTATALTGMPDFTGTAGTKTVGSGSITGNVPTGINVQVQSGSAAVTTTIRAATGAEAPRLNLVIANGGGVVSSVKTSLDTKTLFNGQVNIGDTVRAKIGVRIRSQTLMTNLQIYMSQNGTNNVFNMGRYTSKETAIAYSPAPFDGIFWTQPFTTVAATTTLDLAAAVEVGATTGAADIDVYGFVLEKLT